MKLEKKNKNLQISIIMSIFAKRNHQNIKIMTKEELIDRINDIEWEDFEAKEAKSELPKNIWETVSAFANTSGGWIVLGIKQNGKKFEISGVDNAEKLEQDFQGTLRSQKFNEAVDAKSMLYHIDGHRFFWMDLVEIPGRSMRKARTRYTYRIPEQENLWEYFQIMIRRLRLIVDTPFMMNDEGFNVEDRSQFKILREALVNMLSHFDPFSTIHSCIHIYTDRVEFFNAGGYPVPISQLGNHLYSNPRNPIIAKIFRLVNLSETIGYGFDMMNEWKEITGNDVTFESDICTSTVTFWLDSDRASDRASDKASDRAEDDTYIDATDKVVSILRFCKEAKYRKEIFELLGVTYQFKNFKAFIEPLLQHDYLELTVPDKPTSPKQQYRTTKKGLLFLETV